MLPLFAQTLYFRSKLLTHLVFFFLTYISSIIAAQSIFKYIMIVNLHVQVALLSPHICCA